MPGIVGLITKMPRRWAEPQLQRMVETLRHESFYVAGTWADESLGVYIGWTARKGSFSDGMPLANERDDRVLVFSGEEFPEPGTAGRLRTQGHALEVEGPSYLVHLAEDDPAFPAGLNGTFHGLLADRQHGTATLFNDRYGLKRIYYHEAKEAFYLAAEAKAILAVRPELRELDPRGLGEFVACGCVLENRTLFKAVYAMPPASAWTFRDGSVETKRAYFDPKEWEAQERLDPESYYRELREVFARNLPRYFGGREPVGMSLTGGLDTRMILAWHKPAPGSLRCYTFGGTFRDCRDVVVARQLASALDQPHEVIRLGKDFLARFPYYAGRAVYLSDGCTDVSRAPALYASQKARDIAPVRMTGNYGSQILRAVRASASDAPLPAAFSPELQSDFRQAQARYRALLRTHLVSFAAFRLTPWRHYGLFGLEQMQLSQRSPYLDNELVRTVFRAPKSALVSNDVCLRLITDGNLALGRIRTDRGLGGNHGPLGRALARGYLEFTFKAEYAYDYGMPQWVARIDHLFSPFHFERLFLGRHKFWHFRVWYRDHLADYVRQMLLDPRTLSRTYLRRKEVESMVDAHLKGSGNYTTEIHQALTLELLHRLFLDPR